MHIIYIFIYINITISLHSATYNFKKLDNPKSTDTETVINVMLWNEWCVPFATARNGTYE